MRDLIVLLGIPIDNVDMDEALSRIEEFVHIGRATGKGHQVATVNVDFIAKASKDSELRYLLQNADLATADGMPLLWASKLLKTPLKQRVTGADMVSLLASFAAKKGFSIYLLGAGPGVAQQAAEIFKRENPDLIIAGVDSPPYLPIFAMDPSIQERIRAAHPDILLVAFGNPKQEKWIGMYGEQLGVPVMIGVGGSLDFVTGNTKRAPQWMQSMSLEWLYRLMNEPKRLWRRYLVDSYKFGYGFVRQWLSMVPGFEDGFGVSHTELKIAGKSAILTVKGALNRNNLGEFRSLAKRAGARPEVRVDLSQTTFLDSCALGTLVDLARDVHASKGYFSLVKVPPSLWKILSQLKLETFLNASAGALPQPSTPQRQPALSQSLQTYMVENEGVAWQVIRAPKLLDSVSALDLIHTASQLLGRNNRLIVDLSDTVYLLSAGTAALMQLNELAAKMNGELMFVGGSQEIRQILMTIRAKRAPQVLANISAEMV